MRRSMTSCHDTPHWAPYLLLYSIFHDLRVKTTPREEIAYGSHDTERIKAKSSSLDAWRHPVLKLKLCHTNHFACLLQRAIPLQNEPLPKQRVNSSSKFDYLYTSVGTIIHNHNCQRVPVEIDVPACLVPVIVSKITLVERDWDGMTDTSWHVISNENYEAAITCRFIPTTWV